MSMPVISILIMYNSLFEYHSSCLLQTVSNEVIGCTVAREAKWTCLSAWILRRTAGKSTMSWFCLRSSSRLLFGAFIVHRLLHKYDYLLAILPSVTSGWRVSEYLRLHQTTTWSYSDRRGGLPLVLATLSLAKNGGFSTEKAGSRSVLNHLWWASEVPWSV